MAPPLPEDDQLKFDTPIWFIDDNRYIHQAWVGSIFPSDPPVINIAFISTEGQFRTARAVSHGYHDGAKWRVLDKWFTKEEFNLHSELWEEVRVPVGQGHKFYRKQTITHAKTKA